MTNTKRVLSTGFLRLYQSSLLYALDFSSNGTSPGNRADLKFRAGSRLVVKQGTESRIVNGGGTGTSQAWVRAERVGSPGLPAMGGSMKSSSQLPTVRGRAVLAQLRSASLMIKVSAEFPSMTGSVTTRASPVGRASIATSEGCFIEMLAGVCTQTRVPLPNASGDYLNLFEDGQVADLCHDQFIIAHGRFAHFESYLPILIGLSESGEGVALQVNADAGQRLAARGYVDD